MIATYHQFIGDLGGDHSECQNVQRRIRLEHPIDGLLRNDEGGQNDNGERDDRRDHTRSLHGAVGGYVEKNHVHSAEERENKSRPQEN